MEAPIFRIKILREESTASGLGNIRATPELLYSVRDRNRLTTFRIVLSPNTGGSLKFTQRQQSFEFEAILRSVVDDQLRRIWEIV